MALTLLNIEYTYAASDKAYVTIDGTEDYDQINAVLKLVNQERKKNGLEPLVMDTELVKYAMQRAAEISIYSSHTRPNGTKWSTIIENAQAGATYGENVAKEQKSASEVVNAWMNSQTHKDNILSSKFKSIGIGCFYQSDGSLCWAQLFSTEESTGSYNKSGTVSKKNIAIAIDYKNITTSYTGMAKIGGSWWYMKNGKLDLTYTGLATNRYGTWYMKNGKLDITVTGMRKVSSGWVYIKNGKFDTTYTGMAKNSHGWWYMTNGKLDLTYTGMAKNAYGWWYMTNGKLDLTYTGLATNTYGTWYMKNGKLDKTVTGMRKVSSGWVYIKNGKFDTTYTGMAKNSHGWWYMTNGKLDLTFTGIAKNAYGQWYMKNGKLDTTYTGTITYNGKKYNIVNGKVT